MVGRIYAIRSSGRPSKVSLRASVPQKAMLELVTTEKNEWSGLAYKLLNLVYSVLMRRIYTPSFWLMP